MKRSRDNDYSFFMQFALVTAVGCFLVGLVWRVGWVSDIFAKDSTYLCRAIFAFFVLAVLACASRLWKMTKELNLTRKYIRHLQSGDKEECEAILSPPSRLAEYLGKVKGKRAEDRYSLEENLRSTMTNKISGVANNMNRLTTLGIIGTVVGMKIFLVGFGLSSLGSEPKIAEILKNVLPGLDVAVSATLLGGVCYFWLDWYFQILESAKEQLVAALIEAGVYRASSE